MMTYKYKINGGFLIWVPIQSDWLEYRHDAIHDEVVSVLVNIQTHVCNTSVIRCVQYNLFGSIS